MADKTTTTDLIKRSFIEMMKDIGTSVPGHILSFDPVTQLAQLQIGIQRIDKDGEKKTPPPLIECPVYFPGGSAFHIEYQINAGDEGVILFSQRCIDAWNNAGGVAENPVKRFHDFSDAYFLPGLRSQPNIAPDFKNNGVRMTNHDGSNYMWLKNDGTAAIKITELNVDGNVNVDGDVDVTGDVDAKNVTAATEVTAGTVTLTGHTHPYTWTDPAGSGDTDPGAG